MYLLDHTQTHTVGCGEQHPGVHPKHVQQGLCLLQLAAKIEFTLLDTRIYIYSPQFMYSTNMEIHFIQPIKLFVIFDIK